MEFRTEAPGAKSDDSGDSNSDMFEKLLKQARKELAKSPEKRVAFAQGLAENYGIDPTITALFIPDLEKDLEKIQNNQAETETNVQENESHEALPKSIVNDNQNTSEENMPEIEQEITSDHVIEVVDKIINLLGEDATLKETKEFLDKNSDIVDREIEDVLG